tara:strand:+ start:42 stop:1196 length:1155 start_codon:yes stop_codon:yes gene_type:complete
MGASGLAKLILKEGGEVADEGLRYLGDSFGALKNLLNRYYSNMDRGSKLTTRGKVQDTDLGRMKVNVGKVPLEEMGSTIIKNRKNLDEYSFDIEKALNEEASFIPLIGDRSSGLGALSKVNEQVLENPVNLEAGNSYMRYLPNVEENRVWASDRSRLQPLLDLTEEASIDGKPVYGVFSNMGGESANFSTMVTDTIIEMLPSSKITKKSIKELDEEMSNIVTDWPGIENKNLKSFLNRPNGGGDRVRFSKMLEKAKYSDAGFPDVASIRSAVSEFDMFGLGTGDATGKSIARIYPDQIISDVSGHTTYPSSIQGEYAGRIANSKGEFIDVPRELFFPDFYADRRLRGIAQGGDNRSMEMNPSAQNVTEEMTEKLIKYLDNQSIE